MSSLYTAIGETEGCRKLSASFYARVARDPVLRSLFPRHLECAIESFALFLGQFLGGPCEYSARKWALSLQEAHARFKIGELERDAWLRNMRETLREAPMDTAARQLLEELFASASAYLIGAGPPPTPLPCEELIAAVRRGEWKRAIELAESRQLTDYFERNRLGLVSLLALMCGSQHRAILDYVLAKLAADPGLAAERHGHGRTLLHDAAGEGNLPVIKLLLDLGADPNAADKFGHTPLYALANAGGDGVGALVNGGADVNVKDKVKRCTALHVAARRGSIRIAEALLDCGADLEAKDISGDTPLRRAVNCGKTEVAALLLSRGADLHSRGNRGLTVVQAARSAAMKKVLLSTALGPE